MTTRRISRWAGIVILVLTAGLFALIGVPRTVETLVSSAAVLASGILFVLAGFESIVTKRLGWHRVLGLGFFALGVSQLTNGLFFSIGGDGEFIYAISTVLLALLFAFMGFDIARGGHHFDIDPNETV